MNLKRKLKKIEDMLNFRNEQRAIVVTGDTEEEIEKQLEKLKETYGEKYLKEHMIIKVLIYK